MYKGSNPLALRSQAELAAAALELLSGNDWTHVTISMICQRAQISRQTFYQVFGNKDDLIRYLITRAYEEFIAQVCQHERWTFPDIIRIAFESFARNACFMEIIVMNDMLHNILLEQMQLCMEDLLDRYEPADAASRDILDEYNRSFIIGGLCGLIIKIVTTPGDFDPTRVAASFTALVRMGDFVRKEA